MKDAVNRLAREMADAISAAVSGDPKVSLCRDRAREAGYELQVSIEAVIGFAPTKPESAAAPPEAVAPKRPATFTAYDRRVLRSLRISIDETIEKLD